MNSRAVYIYIYTYSQRTDASFIAKWNRTWKRIEKARERPRRSNESLFQHLIRSLYFSHCLKVKPFFAATGFKRLLVFFKLKCLVLINIAYIHIPQTILLFFLCLSLVLYILLELCLFIQSIWANSKYTKIFIFFIFARD